MLIPGAARVDKTFRTFGECFHCACLSLGLGMLGIRITEKVVLLRAFPINCNDVVVQVSSL